MNTNPIVPGPNISAGLWPFLEKCVPLSCIAVGFLFLSPWAVVSFSLPVIVLIHAASYLGLGVFFEIPELSLNLLCVNWAYKAEDISLLRTRLARILMFRYILTHFVAPATGILTIFSGIYLAYRTGYSFTEGWLFWTIVVSSIGFYKGMYQHNAYLKSLLKINKDQGLNRSNLRRSILSPFDQCLIFLEMPTYIFNYWTAHVKPPWFKNPILSIIGRVENLSSIWIAGFLILMSVSMILIPLRYGIKRYSAINFSWPGVRGQ